MKATITSTDQIVTIDAVGVECNSHQYGSRASCQTKARVWEGVTDGGVPFVAYIPFVQVKRDADNRQFERELIEHAPASPATLLAIDVRFKI